MKKIFALLFLPLSILAMDTPQYPIVEKLTPQSSVPLHDGTYIHLTVNPYSNAIYYETRSNNDIATPLRCISADCANLMVNNIKIRLHTINALGFLSIGPSLIAAFTAKTEQAYVIGLGKMRYPTPSTVSFQSCLQYSLEPLENINFGRTKENHIVISADTEKSRLRWVASQELECVGNKVISVREKNK